MAKKEERLEGAENASDNNPEYVLRLYITGATPNSLRAVANIKEICEQYIKNKYTLQIIDVYQEPALAEPEQLVALPLLIRKKPLPERRMIGDLSDTEKVLKGLGVFNQ